MSRVCKDQLATRVSAVTKVTKADVKDIIDATMDEIRLALEHGDEIVLKDFGIFKTQKMAAKKGHDINTGQAIHIPERLRVKFVPGKKLLECVKKK